MTTTCILNHVLIDANGLCHCPACKGKSKLKKKVSIKSLIKPADSMTDLAPEARLMCMAIVAVELDAHFSAPAYLDEEEWLAAIAKKLHKVHLDEGEQEFCFAMQDRALEDFLSVEVEFGPPA